MTLRQRGYLSEGKKKSIPADEFIDKIWKMSHVHPFMRNTIIFDGNLILTMKHLDWGDDYLSTVHIEFIQSLDKGKGLASRAMKKLIALAKKDGITLEGNVSRVGKAGLTKTQLKKWYKRLGANMKGDKATWG